MKLTIDWLKEHLHTKNNDNKIINKLTDIGLEVENFEKQTNELDSFIVAKIVSSEKHPNADKLKVCDVDIGNKELVKVVCGAPNAKENLLTIYAPPGSTIPKNQMKLSVSKIRGVTSYGMLCSESELKLSNNSQGITELPSIKFSSKIGTKFFYNKSPKVLDLSITPNRADCLGIRGIARDLAAAGAGKLKDFNDIKVKNDNKLNFRIKILKEKPQGCTAFGSCLIKNVKNHESPKWLKEKIISLGQKPISAIVDITNYVMIDLNRPLHAYDADKINKMIIVRNAKNGESFKALDNKVYKLDKDMCVIADNKNVLGLGGIIGGESTGTELGTKNILLESAYFNPRSIRKTSKSLNIETDAKFRFERGIDPNSILIGLRRAAELIKKICGGKIGKFDIQKIENIKNKIINFDSSLIKKITGFEVKNKEILKILKDLGFEIKKNKKTLKLKVPSWRPDIEQPIDIVEEITRIKGYDQIKTILPEKVRTKSTLNNQQKLFHFIQRSIASKGYAESVTWSFTNSKVNQIFSETNKKIEIINPISSDLDVLRNSIFSNLVTHLGKNIDRGFKDVSMFEIGPIFSGHKPGEQKIVVGALRCGKISRNNWAEKDRLIDLYDAKRDVMQTLIEVGIHSEKLHINEKAPGYYHPGKSGTIFLENEQTKPLAYFGEAHPNILKKLDLKTESLVFFEIFIENIEIKEKLVSQKSKYNPSIYQKSERDFAFIVDKDLKVQDLINTIANTDKKLIKSIKVFDVYQGENIPDDKKSVAINVTIQSSEKTLDDNDLDKINKEIISTVETRFGAKIRS